MLGSGKEMQMKECYWDACSHNDLKLVQREVGVMKGWYCNRVDIVYIVYDWGLFREPESLAMNGGFTECEGKVNLHIVASLRICHL